MSAGPQWEMGGCTAPVTRLPAVFGAPTDLTMFESVESEVRSYCRSWPTVFDWARGSHIHAEDGRTYLDFFVGAGTLNYGHNNPVSKRALVDYIERDGIAHGLDMYTTAKRNFLQAFHDIVLRPRHLAYKVMFPGPAGTNAVEAALKLARKVTGRESIVSFRNSFHGMTLGSLAVSDIALKIAGATVPPVRNISVPFDDAHGHVSEFPGLDRLLDETGSSRPAAVIVETVQGEGGIHVARSQWLRALSDLCRQHDVLLIVDDIQMGCGRTGAFFSFEEARVVPDIVTVSKAISGYGLPLALTLFKPELDVWAPGEHNGTFRGNNLAFVTATATLKAYWVDEQLEKQTLARGDHIEEALQHICGKHFELRASYRGRGMVWGLTFPDISCAKAIHRRAFELGLLIETSGPHGEVVKLMPPLTCSTEELDEGLRILGRAVREIA